jgi:hypothetical protein
MYFFFIIILDLQIILTFANEGLNTFNDIAFNFDDARSLNKAKV